MVSVFKIKMGWSWIHFVPTTREGLWSIHLYCLHQITSARARTVQEHTTGRDWQGAWTPGNQMGICAARSPLSNGKLIATDDSLLHGHHSPIEILGESIASSDYLAALRNSFTFPIFPHPHQTLSLVLHWNQFVLGDSSQDSPASRCSVATLLNMFQWHQWRSPQITNESWDPLSRRC